MENSWTKKAREEISHHIGKNKKIDNARIVYDELEVKRDLRIKFIEAGLLNDPHREYRLEFRFKNLVTANTTIKRLGSYDISGKLSINDKRKVVIVYIVDATTIMTTLKLLGANETLKAYKKIVEERKQIAYTNRRVNFETANIRKSANASLNQLEDIKKLLKKRDINSLDRDLRVVIKARNKYKTSSLAELAEKVGISKNALSHRFMKIRRMVENR